jgi:hypothetical protein
MGEDSRILIAKRNPFARDEDQVSRVDCDDLQDSRERRYARLQQSLGKIRMVFGLNGRKKRGIRGRGEGGGGRDSLGEIEYFTSRTTEGQGVRVSAGHPSGMLGPPVVKKTPDGRQYQLSAQGLANLNGRADLHHGTQLFKSLTTVFLIFLRSTGETGGSLAADRFLPFE